MKLKKIFDGKIYEFYGSYRTKREAKEIAVLFRKSQLKTLARVVKVGKEYYLYIRNKYYGG